MLSGLTARGARRGCYALLGKLKTTIRERDAGEASAKEKRA